MEKAEMTLEEKQEELTLAQLFELVISCDPSLVSEPFFVNRRTEHTNGDGDVYYLFNDGSIYSFKHKETFRSLDSMKDVLCDDWLEILNRCETLGDVLKLKWAKDSRCSVRAKN